MTHQQQAVPLRQQGIVLDAESVRAELEEAPEAHGFTAQNAELVSKVDDEQILAAINIEVDDEFWSQYDDVRRRAITRLAESLGIERDA